MVFPETNKDKSLAIPEKLPLLEGLCWNIANPYALSLQDMLAIYESRWKYWELLGKADQEELTFIQKLCQRLNHPSLLPEQLNMDKQEFFVLSQTILRQINREFLLQLEVCFGGGTMLAMEQDYDTVGEFKNCAFRRSL